MENKDANMNTLNILKKELYSIIERKYNNASYHLDLIAVIETFKQKHWHELLGKDYDAAFELVEKIEQTNEYKKMYSERDEYITNYYLYIEGNNINRSTN